MPGMEARAPERTETRRGRAGSPSLRPTAASRRASAASTCSQSPDGCLRPPVAWADQASVVIVKPGGTGTPRLVISASSQPFPPSRCRRALDPSALPLAKEYTYLGRRATPRAAFVRAPLRTVACAISSTPSVGPLGLQRKKGRPRRGLHYPAMVCERMGNVNEYSCVTGTYETLGRLLRVLTRLRRTPSTPPVTSFSTAAR